jgi:superfamily II DNA/RNA helicase
VALHGALSQGLRNRRLMALRNGQVQILVATDVAARGIDVPTITHVFNFGLPMKAEDYTHRIGRTGRAGRDGLAVTFAEFRDRRKIFDIEAYSKQPFKAETIPGLEPKQRMPDARSERSNFGGRNSRGGERDTFSRDRKFGNGNRSGFGGSRGGFGGDRTSFAPRDDRGGDRRGFGAERPAAGGFGGGFAPRDERGGERREGFSYERKGGFNDRFAGDGRRDGGAPRGDFAPRKPAFAKPGAGGGKVFVPRDTKKRAPRPAR